ncbi:MAG: NAD-dependent protein deacetylase [Gemmatimonadota bacterium]
MRPEADPVAEQLPPLIEALAALMRERPTVVLSGAGISTESGIPDYRSPASAPRRPPIQFREFIGDEAVRQRYWTRSSVGWRRVADAQPNAGHRALARLEQAGLIRGIITQNVDELHQRAGSSRVLELHGTLSTVRCLSCDDRSTREALQQRLLAENPALSETLAPVAPDGDAEVPTALIAGVRVPACQACGGMLKPDVVFFGENVPKPRVENAWSLYRDGDVLLVVGSSLTVFSGYRFVLKASQEGRPIAIANLGPTRGDPLAAMRVEGPLGTVLPALSDALGVAGPA